MRFLASSIAMVGLFGLGGCDELDIGDGDAPPFEDTGDRLDPFDPNGTPISSDDLTNTGGYFGLEPYGADTGFGADGIPTPGLF